MQGMFSRFLVICFSAAFAMMGTAMAQVEKVYLYPDDYHLTHVGRLETGQFYWIDVQLNADRGVGDTEDFVCTYIFDADGTLVAHEIESVGFRKSQSQSVREVVEQHFDKLPAPKSAKIQIRPFEVTHQDLTFGLVPREVEDNPGEWVVDVEPGWTLMFYPPWEEGGYDT